MNAFPAFTSKCVVLPIDNIDTDRIIPARFLKTTSRSALGQALFADWRYRTDGELDTGFPLNGPDATGAEILLVGHNFGCGSSREHAPWALLGAGFRAVISTGFADIFRGNALRNRLLTITVDQHVWQAIAAAVRDDPGARLSIDLRNESLSLRELGSVTFTLDAFARECLLEGVDELGYILARDALITALEAGHPSPISTTGNRVD
jgi:3-isopropylmalate/(R)-2-methylmalate dehydratase small subunit